MTASLGQAESYTDAIHKCLVSIRNDRSLYDSYYVSVTVSVHLFSMQCKFVFEGKATTQTCLWHLAELGGGGNKVKILKRDHGVLTLTSTYKYKVCSTCTVQ